MTKKLISAAIVVLMAKILYAQQPNIDQLKVTWSDEMEREKVLVFSDVLGKYNNNVYAVFENTLSSMSAGTNTAVLEIYDPTMKRIARNELVVRFKDNEVSYRSARGVKDNFYLFTTFWDRKERVSYFLANKISKEDGKIQGDPKVLFEASNDKGSAPFIGHSVSFDSSKIVLYSDLEDKKDENETVYFKAFDNNLNSIWEDRITFPYTSKQFTVSNYLIDNLGNMHILGKVTKERGEREKGEPSYFYTLISYYHKTKELKEYNPNVGDAYISYIRLLSDKNNNILMTGFYSERSDNNIKGVYYSRINAETKSIVNQTIKMFDPELVAKFIGERRALKGKEITDLIMDHTILDDNGNLTILAEQFYTQTVTYTSSNGQTSSRTYYHYMKILLLKFNAQGEVLWWDVIRKSQVTSGNTEYFSYMYGMRGENIYILYNDHKKNIDQVDPDKIYTLTVARDAITVMVMVSPDGSMKKIPMFEAKDDEGNTIFKPVSSIRITQNEYLAISKKGKKYYKMGKFVF